jgi:hypothetical protein
MNLYPAYYRKGPVCIKREDSCSGKQVDLSEQASGKPFRMIQTPNKAAFDQIIASMELVSNDTYERYLILLHNKSRFEARSFRDTHERSPEFLNPSPRRDYSD